MKEKLEQTKYGLNRGNLKMIALFCMTLDHIAAVILESWAEVLNPSLGHACVSVLIFFLRFIGRLAFPIFCFFIVEGVFHTRNVFKYALRLFLLAVISEVPYNMAENHTYFWSESGNVFWTLLLGMLTVFCMDGIFTKFRCHKALKYIAAGIVFALPVVTESFIYTDYGIYGILAIVVIYLVSKGKYTFAIILNVTGFIADYIVEKDFSIASAVLILMGLIVSSGLIFVSRSVLNINSKKMFASCAVLTGMSVFELSAFANVFLMQFYNGQKGRKIGWFFYFYYPAHLAALAGLCMLLGLY